MRPLVVKMSVSVDGFVATPDRAVDWLFPSMSEDATRWMVDTLRGAGAHLVGRATYLDMAAYWPTSDEPVAEPMNTIPKVVFSRTLRSADWGPVRIADGDLARTVAELKRQQGGYLLAHGGAGFAQALSRLGLVDEYRLVVHPVALGAGLPLFTGAVGLELISTTPFSGGAMANTYRPA